MHAFVNQSTSFFGFGKSRNPAVKYEQRCFFRFADFFPLRFLLEFKRMFQKHRTAHPKKKISLGYSTPAIWVCCCVSRKEIWICCCVYPAKGYKKEKVFTILSDTPSEAIRKFDQNVESFRVKNSFRVVIYFSISRAYCSYVSLNMTNSFSISRAYCSYVCVNISYVE